MNTLGPKLGAIDLNLLVVFDAIMGERSVTQAGKRLGLSQPAISHALTRLRHVLKDELFVRSPHGMAPTPLAEQIAEPIKVALEGLRLAFEPGRFDPSSATDAFRITVDNYAAIFIVAPVACEICHAAPGLSLDFHPSATLDVPKLLDQGDVDLAMGPFPEQGERFSRQLLFEDEFVVVMSAQHEAAKPGRVSLPEYAGFRHLEISSVHHTTAFVDRMLASEGLHRKIALRAPFLSSAGILASSDLVCLLPIRVAQQLSRYRPLATRHLMGQLQTMQTVMIWPRRLQNHPAHHWLRERVAEVALKLNKFPVDLAQATASSASS